MSGLLVLLGAALLVIAWDVVLLSKHETTISDEIQRGAIARPVVAWFIGLLMGALGAHWFWLPTECVELLRGL